jgi:hypothetical protein
MAFNTWFSISCLIASSGGVITLMIVIFWEITPCCSYKNRRFGGLYRLHLQGARVRAGYRAKMLALV